MLRSAHVRWLRSELPELVAAGVVSEEAAARLRAHFGDEDEDEGAGARVVMVLFGVLGALLIGGGIILLLAHNWDELSRPVRAAVSIAPLAGSLALAAWVIATGRGAGWHEPAAALWTLSIGAAIALVSQTYNLSGDWPALLTAWLLLAVPIVYLLRSDAAALLYCLGAIAWVLHNSTGPNDATWFWGLLALLAPFVVVRLRRRSEAGGVLLAWTVAATVAWGLLPSLEILDQRWWAPILVSGMAGLWLGGELARPRRWALALRVIGGAVTVGAALVLTFSDVWDDLSRGRVPGGGAELVAEWLVIAAVAIAALALAVAARRRGAPVLAIGAAVPVIWCAQGLALGMKPGLAAMLVDLYLIALGVVMLTAGVRADRLGRANLGAAVLGLLILLRFFDTEWSSLVRGAAFIAVGIGFLLVNVWLVRRRRAA